MSKIKILFFIIIGFICMFFLSISISILLSHNENDFNIPKDFLNTKYLDKDPLSSENGYNDYMNFNKLLSNPDNKDLYGYYNILSKCIFETNTPIEIKTCELHEKNKNNFPTIPSFEEFKKIIFINQIKYKNINSKTYILQPIEYSSISGNIFTYESLLKYSNSINYLAYDYFKKGEYAKGIDILLKHQLFIDNLLKKSDTDLLNTLVLMNLNNINLNAIDYFITNYKLDSKIKDTLYLSLKGFDREGFIDNALKHDLLEINYFLENIFNKGKLNNIFFSLNETKLLLLKYRYDHIINKGSNGKFKHILNFHNFIGRNFIHMTKVDNYSNQYKKENEMGILRLEILEKLKK